MKKQTKVALVLGVVAIGGFLLWKARQPQKTNLTGLKMNEDCGCNKSADAGKVQLPEFGKPLDLK
jgi:hypothetical protein